MIYPVPTIKGLAFYGWIDGKRHGIGYRWNVVLKHPGGVAKHVKRGFRVARILQEASK